MSAPPYLMRIMLSGAYNGESISRANETEKKPSRLEVRPKFNSQQFLLTYVVNFVESFDKVTGEKSPFHSLTEL